MKKTVLKFRTVVLSDIHLGAPDCQVDKVNDFIKHVHCKKLILNGDIIDCWSLRRKGGWNRQHTRFIRLVLKMTEKRKNFEVIYLRGNHDDLIAQFLPIHFDNFRIQEEYILESENGNYLCVHGDVFDSVTQNTRFIAIAGDIGYQTLLRINRYYNRWRRWRGKEYFSLSKAIKAKVKSAVNYISRFEDQVVNMTHKRNCKGFICGHIHTPDNKMLEDVHYLNSGDWVESNTALVENLDGTWEILEYETFRERLENKMRQEEYEKDESDLVPIEDDEELIPQAAS
jgi:UDP-2,3-diacylglucosamine pyrophosphatase LpxH